MNQPACTVQLFERHGFVAPESLVKEICNAVFRKDKHS